MPRKRKKIRRTERLTLSLTSKEKSFIKAFRRKFNEKLETNFSYGEIFLLLCDDEATKQKVRPVLKQLSIFESCAEGDCAEL
ncbi:MAG: hypothetical protein KTR26_18230 [Flammeovirgaceae bacterium]|nr:hypothetical protein [Flammeovirgaceae bacterium]